jgi:hypothetical protein
MQSRRRDAANKTNSFQECLEITWEHKRNYTIEGIVGRASRAIEEGIPQRHHGIPRVRGRR